MQSKGLSRVFSSNTIQKHQFFGICLLYGPTLTTVSVYWKNHSFDYMDLCWQTDISAFNTLSRFLKAAILQQKINLKKRNPLAHLSNEVLWEDVGKLTNQRENWNKHTNQDSGRTRNQKSSGQETTIIPARPHGGNRVYPVFTRLLFRRKFWEQPWVLGLRLG